MFDVKKFDVMSDDEIIATVKSWKLKKSALIGAIEFLEDGFKKHLGKRKYNNYYKELYKWEQDHENIKVRYDKGARKSLCTRNSNDLEKLLSELIRLDRVYNRNYILASYITNTGIDIVDSDDLRANGLKVCKQCNMTLPINQFWKGAYVCKKCKKEAKKIEHDSYFNDIKAELMKNPEKYNYNPNKPIYGIIYLVHNTINGKYYVGQTTQGFDMRYPNGWIYDHLDHPKVKPDIKKYGSKCFEYTKIFKVASNQYDLDKLEAFYIRVYDSYYNGYNCNQGNYKSRRGYDEKVKLRYF